MNAAILPQAMTVGASVLALWLYVRLGRRAPNSSWTVLVHAAVAFIALSVVHALIDVPAAGRSPWPTAALFAFFLPAVTYAFLTALYLLEHLQRALTVR
jgi:hypothetical protein